MFSSQGAVLRADNIQWKLIEDRAVLLDLDEGLVFQLDKVGTSIWLKIDGKKNIDQLAESITEEFVVPLSRAKKDVRHFLNQLVKDEVVFYAKG